MSNITTTPAVFQFHTHQVRTIVKDGEPWFIASDVCATLGYRDAATGARCLDDDEKGMHIVCTLGGEQKLTVINESGLYALVLRSRKPEARKFAKWVTSEVLPAIRKTGKFDVKTASGPLTEEMREIVKGMVVDRAKALPIGQQKGAIIKAWSALKTHFGMSYKEIPIDKFAEALSLVARMQVEWELVEPEVLPAQTLARYHYPLEAADPHDRNRQLGNAWLTPKVLLDPKNRALELELIDQLEKDGNDVAGLKMRILALRDAAGNYLALQARVKHWQARLDGAREEMTSYSAPRGKNVLFVGRPNPGSDIDRQTFPDQMGRAGVACPP